MLTEEDQERQDIERIKSAIQVCNDGIAKAEKYERLSMNPDWKDFLKDLEIRASMHDKEIQLAIGIMDEAPNSTVVKDGKLISSKLDWVDFIRNHKIRSDVIRSWAKDPELMMSFASDCRKRLPILLKQLEKYKKEPIGAGGNGAS